MDLMFSMGVKCSVCNLPGRVKLENEALGLYRCLSCQHVFKKIPKDKEEGYSSRYYEYTHKNWFTYPNYGLFELIRKKIHCITGKKTYSLMDAGCGRGDFLKYMRTLEPGTKLYGMDLTYNEHPGIKFIKGDILKDPVDMKFDIVTSLASIEHADDPALFVGKLSETLKEEGLLIIMTDNDNALIYRIARAMNFLGLKDAYSRLYYNHHLQCFSNGSLRLLLESCGFEMLFIKNHNYPIRAVDFPKAGHFKLACYKIFTGLIFLVSWFLNASILQTAIFKKKSIKDR